MCDIDGWVKGTTPKCKLFLIIQRALGPHTKVR